VSVSKDLITAARVFSQLPYSTLTALADSGYLLPCDLSLDATGRVVSPTQKCIQLLKLRERLEEKLAEHRNCPVTLSQAYEEAAAELYHNEDDLQTNIDPITVPFDISEADDGTWVHAWVWVPNEKIEERKAELDAAKQAAKAARRKKYKTTAKGKNTDGS
jgi:hypothetical protein